MSRRKKKVKRLQELNLSDNFLFGEVMSDPETCSTALEIILERDVSDIVRAGKEQAVDINPEYKGIRLDVLFQDDEGHLFNLEMQNLNRNHLPKRSRHYQSMIDIKLLSSGEVDYSKLPDGMIIFICTFDPFRRKRYRYTFENRCVEEPDLALGDGVKKIFLNTKGKKLDNVNPELIDFLRYVENTTSYNPVTEPVCKIAERVEKVKADAQVEVRYMTLEIFKNEMLAEGEARGVKKEQKRMLLLIKKMTEAGEVSLLSNLSEPSFLENMYQKYQV